MFKRYFILFCLNCLVQGAFCDPFKPLEGQYSEQDDSFIDSDDLALHKELVIESLIVSSKGRLAIINGVSYKIGDKISHFIIIDINVDKVILEDQFTQEKQELFAGFKWPSTSHKGDQR